MRKEVYAKPPIYRTLQSMQAQAGLHCIHMVKAGIFTIKNRTDSKLHKEAASHQPCSSSSHEHQSSCSTQHLPRPNLHRDLPPPANAVARNFCSQWLRCDTYRDAEVKPPGKCLQLPAQPRKRLTNGGICPARLLGAVCPVKTSVEVGPYRQLTSISSGGAIAQRAEYSCATTRDHKCHTDNLHTAADRHQERQYAAVRSHMEPL